MKKGSKIILHIQIIFKQNYFWQKQNKIFTLHTYQFTYTHTKININTHLYTIYKYTYTYS